MSRLIDLHPFETPVNRVTVMEGDFHVSRQTEDVLTTVLGSCVAVCVHDLHARIGGMNHFLLAEPVSGSGKDTQSLERFGTFAMERLINEMIKAGGHRDTMRAHVYGGASISRGMERIGLANREFAMRFLAQDRILVSREDTGGYAARRLEFRPAYGQARCRSVPISEAPPARVVRAALPPVGDVELF